MSNTQQKKKSTAAAVVGAVGGAVGAAAAVVTRPISYAAAAARPNHAGAGAGAGSGGGSGGVSGGVSGGASGGSLPPLGPKSTTDLVQNLRGYAERMVSEGGMKVLLLDSTMSTIVALVITQTDVLKKEVYLIDRIDEPKREPMKQLKAICFVQPSQESVDFLIAELKAPKYSKYEIYFSHIVRPQLLERLAQSDQGELVQDVQEVYALYYPISHCHFTLHIPRIVGDTPYQWRRDALDSVIQGLTSVFLAGRKRPCIRAQNTPLCTKLAQELSSFMQSESALCEFPREPPPVLLILDRWDDPVTPLLTQWTYEAMVHELIGIKNNRVDLSKAENIHADLKDIVFSAQGDPFFAENAYSNFGEVGNALRKLVDTYQLQTKGHENIETIEDIKAFISNYPAFRAMSATVSKHVALVGELSRIAEQQNLYDVSEVEQQIVCQMSHSETVQRIKDVLSDQKLTPFHRAKLVLLYALRYETQQNSQLSDLMHSLQLFYVDEKLRDLIPMTLSLVGQASRSRQSDLFGVSKPMNLIKKKLGSLKGVENIYTQHKPLCMTTLDMLLKGRLSEKQFPIIDRNNLRPREVYLYFVGGTTYEESRAIDLFNRANNEVKVFIGGNTVHNSHTFLTELKHIHTSTQGGAV